MSNKADLEYAAGRFQAAVAARRAARDNLVAAVVVACEDGLPDKQAAELAGVTIPTIRAWRGKLVGTDYPLAKVS